MATNILLGLDVGSIRIGVSLARSDVRIASPLLTLQNDGHVYDTIAALVTEHSATVLVVGWPRGMQGQETAQTKIVEAFVAELRKHVNIPIHLQDEALTSQKAEEELHSRNKLFAKADVDALAATYILDDYMLTAYEASHV